MFGHQIGQVSHINTSNADTREVYHISSVSARAGGNFMEIEEVVLRSGGSQREPISDKRLHMLLNYAVGIIAEILGFALAFVIVLCMAGVLR